MAAKHLDGNRYDASVPLTRDPILAAQVRRFRAAMIAFVVGLVLSGVTAFPLLHEVELLGRLLRVDEPPTPTTGVAAWIAHVRDGLRDTHARYPFLAYGTDWLAFGHLVIALFFVDPIVRPRRDHDATLLVGMVACVGVFPLAFIAGEVRGIPWGWRLLDCAFGVLGLLPLLYAYRVGRRIREA